MHALTRSWAPPASCALDRMAGQSASQQHARCLGQRRPARFHAAARHAPPRSATLRAGGEWRRVQKKLTFEEKASVTAFKFLDVGAARTLCRSLPTTQRSSSFRHRHQPRPASGRVAAHGGLRATCWCRPDRPGAHRRIARGRCGEGSRSLRRCRGRGRHGRPAPAGASDTSWPAREVLAGDRGLRHIFHEIDDRQAPTATSLPSHRRRALAAAAARHWWAAPGWGRRARGAPRAGSGGGRHHRGTRPARLDHGRTNASRLRWWPGRRQRALRPVSAAEYGVAVEACPLCRARLAQASAPAGLVAAARCSQTPPCGDRSRGRVSGASAAHQGVPTEAYSAWSWESAVVQARPKCLSDEILGA